MKQIRHQVFETNSSSTHSICIPKTDNLEFPTEIRFKPGDFGWEFLTISSIEEKASYLYTALYTLEEFDYIKELKQILTAKGITSIFSDIDEYSGYIDHCRDLDDFVNTIKSDENILFLYLFSPFAYILTGNDNCDRSVNIDVNYEHYNFYKGN